MQYREHLPQLQDEDMQQTTQLFRLGWRPNEHRLRGAKGSGRLLCYWWVFSGKSSSSPLCLCGFAGVQIEARAPARQNFVRLSSLPHQRNGDWSMSLVSRAWRAGRVFMRLASFCERDHERSFVCNGWRRAITRPHRYRNSFIQHGCTFHEHSIIPSS